MLNGDCQGKRKLAERWSCECRCLEAMGISMSTPLDACCGMPSCMRLARAREQLPPPLEWTILPHVSFSWYRVLAFVSLLLY